MSPASASARTRVPGKFADIPPNDATVSDAPQKPLAGASPEQAERGRTPNATSATRAGSLRMRSTLTDCGASRRGGGLAGSPGPKYVEE